MFSSTLPPIITWDYQFAPNAQKSRNYLHATDTPFKICEQPFVLPRPILEDLGVTYRRVPVISIGKDVFCDNTCFIDAMQMLLEKQGKGLKRSKHDRAYEQWGYRSFWVCLACVPASLISKDLAKDRANLFPVFAREDFGTLKQNGLSELRSLLTTAENEFLGDGKGPFIDGAECGLADVHAMWMIKWALHTISVAKEPGFDEQAFPKVHRWCNALPIHDDEIQKDQFVSAEEATKQILACEYACPDVGVDAADPLQLKEGEGVAVEMTDATPGYFPQKGALVGLSRSRIVVQLENGLRVHFPRVGYHVRRQSERRVPPARVTAYVVILASAQPTFDQAYGSSSGGAGKGSWLSRVSHRASHIPNRPLPLRTPGSAGSVASSGFPSSGNRSHERLPVLHKTSSYPASPTSPASPTETEFASTPIDASFSERLEALPPERPPPARPSASDRAGLPSQRSRSGTATQVEALPRKKSQKMNKYARQAGDDSYDSEGAEADDEFERTVFSPTMPTQFDDHDTDHPSESEDEHESVDGDDTPTTQAWTEREGRSPTGIVTQWTEEQVADYIASLSPALKPYGQAFADEGVNGEALVALHHDELRELGVVSVGHRLTILKAVYESKIRSGVKIEEGDYVPLSAEGDRSDFTATQDDIARVIESIRLRDQRILATEAELKALKQDLDRVIEDNRKLREETLPIMRLVKDQRTPLPDPVGGTIPSPRDIEVPKLNENLAPVPQSKGSSLSRKFSTKKLFLGGAPKQPSPTHPPQSHTPQPREVRDDPGGTHLEASAAAMAASTHLTASMTSQTSPSSLHTQQLSPTSPAYSTQAPSSGGSYHPPSSAAARSFPRDPAPIRHAYAHQDDSGTGYSTSSQWSNASTIVADREPPASARPLRRQVPTPSPRDDEAPQTAPLPRDRDRERERDRDRGNPDNPVEIFKSFRVGIEDPCRVVLPVALKRYNITDDWRQYALYIVHGDQERCLGLEEKPLLLFKQLDKEGRKPMFMLRRHASPQEGWSGMASHSQEKSIPGGVL
ncbi:hypothetical protein BAUCODRAFT_146481 [Baudoinia panamericana UAMH 10762]|uniref:SAM domain-containing protein n=1 Tax=Baudoinia panamericana (strain UAMH 10762) TaxID=717646 RepID=M2N1S0_BAUPA|nr:uncharacterized protein BAUCODRAFT_146481 [Baudoinia panamericana UAMH 10762]EMC97873.1 hypothetical protein BAUCODRAFT_146481 [Baudoinia panamericana UAMH 10762]